MKSLKELYRVGRGPSSSHTMGPERAALLFAQRHPAAERFRVRLYGSLARTGRGHGTDTVLQKTLPRPAEIVFDTRTEELPHPNTMDFQALEEGTWSAPWRVLSVGGGEIEAEGIEHITPPEIYPLNTFNEIAALCRAEDIRLSDYVERCEGPEIWDFLERIWTRMKQTVREGLAADGVLPGGLGVQRKARYLHQSHHMDESAETAENRMVCAYAYAVSEQNAAGGIIVTAPTCGASGVLPAVLVYMQKKHRFSEEQILRALAVGGLLGNLIKTNASISGAECGCQAEVGTACSMAAGALAELFGMSLEKIEYAAEVAMEHHLGLTCDPIRGLVQIPCIERNAVAAMRAINALSLANFLFCTRKISFDLVVQTMYETGRDLPGPYRETGEGGLAKLYRQEE